MKPYQRQAKALELLRQDGYVSVEELSQVTGASRMTIRRDLEQLQQMNLIARHHGGATLATEQGDLEWPWLVRQSLRSEQKQKIGQVAASYIHDGDVVILDGGSTTLEVARSLTQDQLTVVSYCLPILCHLSSRRNVNLVGVGGSLLWDNQSFVGRWAIDTVRSINANVAIMGTTCLSLARGMTNLNIQEAELKRSAIDVSDKAILVADSTKMHRHTLATVGPLEMIDILITDPDLLAEDRETIQAMGVEVVIAG